MVLLQSISLDKNWSAPNFKALGVDGKLYSLEDFTTKKGLAIIFTCNHCPFAVASRSVIQDLSTTYTDIGIICISSNDASYVPEDNYEQMQSLAKSMKFGFPYVYDENQSIAKAYKAQCTPDNYLFKNTGTSFELFYHGRLVDDRKNPTTANHKDFERHVEKLLENQEADTIQHHSIGCSIKRK